MEKAVKNKITTFEDLKIYKDGQIVELPDFAEGQPFVAKMKRPSLMSLATDGSIPNSLLEVASKLFTKGFDGNEKDSLKSMYEVCRIIAKASLVSPTYKEIEQAGITLSDDQLLAIFNYSQQGVKGLKSFRVE